MVDSVRFKSSINKMGVMASSSLKRMAVVVSEQDVPVYDVETNKAGFKPSERWRFAESSAELLSWGFDAKSEAVKFLTGALKAKGKYANISFLPGLGDFEVLCIVKKEGETVVESINAANLSMSFGYFGLVLAQSLAGEINDVVNAFSGKYLISLNDSSLFGDVRDAGSFRSGHLFNSLIDANVPVLLNYQLPKERSELEFPLSVVALGYICATFGTERPGVSAYFKTLEGVAADNLPSFVVNQIDEELKRKVNTYRANEAESYKWNIMADGESVEMRTLVEYTKEQLSVLNQNLVKTGLPFNDNGFREVLEVTGRFMGLLLRAEKIQSFELEAPKFAELSAEAREKSLFAYTLRVVSGGVMKEIEVSAVFSK